MIRLRFIAYTSRTIVLACLAGTLMAQDISSSAQQQMAAILAVKANFTPAQKKVGSDLVLAAMVARNDLGTAAFSSMVPKPGTDSSGRVVVDIRGNLTPSLAGAVAAAGGTVINQSTRFGMVHASVPLNGIEGFGR